MEKDYFTSARPWAQKGDSVTLPMAGAGELEVDFERPTDGSFPKFRGGTNSEPVDNEDIITGDDGRVEIQLELQLGMTRLVL